jgi:NitT/TauT family transport system ATP-binding protein
VIPAQADSQAPLVSLAGVSLTYPNGVRALAPASVSVRPGEFVSVIGPSGCGKSTLLRLAAGLLLPAEGTVSRAADCRPAFVFQSPTLMPWASVSRNVALPLELEKVPTAEARERVAEALQRVGLSEFGDALPRELSGGMQMRASIARALVTQPRLLLMDEPFGALDEITRARLDRELLALWRARALGVLFVTHSLYEAVFLSTRILVMSPRPGRIAAELVVDEPAPRDDAFRVSPRFAQLCAHLQDEMTRAGAT